MSVGSVRRFYLLKRQAAAALDEPLAETWQAKQEAEPGTALPADFPDLEVLVAAGYSAVEDLDGAEAQELVDLGLAPHRADAVLLALQELL